MDPAFRIDSNKYTDFDYFIFHGNIDSHAEKLLTDLPRKIRGPVVKFDFSNTGRINSMGIALLLRCLKSIKEEKQADIQLVKLNPTFTMLFKMTGIFLLAHHEQ